MLLHFHSFFMLANTPGKVFLTNLKVEWTPRGPIVAGARSSRLLLNVSEVATHKQSKEEKL